MFFDLLYDKTQKFFYFIFLMYKKAFQALPMGELSRSDREGLIIKYQDF